MEIGTLFKLKEDANIYKVINNPSGTCAACCAKKKVSLCFNMPYCDEKVPVCFEKLSTYEARKVKKEKQHIEYFED